MLDVLKYVVAFGLVLASGFAGLLLFALSSYFQQPLSFGQKWAAWGLLLAAAAGLFAIAKSLGL